MQAIIAGTEGNEKYMPLLRHMETVVPRIYAVPAVASYSYETYVPKNSWDSQRGQSFEQRNASSRKRVNVRLFSGAEAHVVYDYEIPPELAPTFEEAISQVGVVGRAMDMVVTKVSDAPPCGNFDVFVPEAVNVRGARLPLNAPVPGFIDSVFKRYRQEATLLTVASKPFTKNPRRELSRALFALTQPVRIEYASHVAAWIRHAAMASARKDVAASISGHYPERLMIVPVPTTTFNDNRIRRVIVTGEDETLVRAATSALAGLSLRDNEGHNRGYLIPDEYDGVFAQFLNSSKRWATVTPILISGYDDHDPRKRQRLFDKMFRHAGLPQPKSVVELKGNASDFAVGAKHGHDRLHRIHCAVEFDEEVSGVVAVGTGRYAGLGVFANLSRSAAV